MSTKTRYFVIASLLVLTVGLGTGLVAYYSGLTLGALGREAGPEDLRFLPSDASMVAYAEVGQIMASPLREKLRSFLPMPPSGQQEFQDHTGINIETDIDRVLAAIVPSRTSTEQHGSGLLIARGRFDQVKIENLMREHGATIETYKNQRLIVAPTTDRPENGVSVAFLEPGLIAVGSPLLIKNAVDLKDGGASVMTNEDLMTRIRDLETGNAWAVGHFDALAAQAKLPQGMSESLPAVSWISATATIDTGLRATVRAETVDEAAANSLRDVVRGFVALAKLQTSGRPEIQTFMQTLTLGGSGNTVTLSFDAPAEVFDAVHAVVQGLGPQALAH